MKEISISAQKIGEFFGFPITNTFLLSLLFSFFLFIIFFLTFKRTSLYPSKYQNFFDWILETLLKYFESLVGEKQTAKEIFPIASTLFLYILFCNLSEIIPLSAISHYWRTPSSDLNFTLALAIFSMIYIHLLAIKKLGPFNYLKKFIKPKNPILTFAGILEIFGEMSRIISLSLRLFGNLFAGSVLLGFVSLIFYFLFPLPFLLLEILVAFVQALIFSSLVVIFYSSAIKIH
jgi:F-type H+-transporting ATPase subunit a